MYYAIEIFKPFFKIIPFNAVGAKYADQYSSGVNHEGMLLFSQLF